MSFRRYNPNQVNTRKFRLTTPDFGVLIFASFGALERQVMTANLPSGQAMSTGKIESQDTQATVLLRDMETCAVLEKWARQSENGADGYIQPGTGEYVLASGGVGAVVEIEEIWCVGINYPETDEVKYVHGNLGRGTFTFMGGHDPEDYRHMVGDPPTILSMHKNSPGYRLILNSVLFPAAKKQERKT